MNTGEGKSTSSYTYTATASKISYYYSVKWSWNHSREFRMSVPSQPSYSGTRKGTDKSNEIIRERLLCKETPSRWRRVGLGGGRGQLRQDMRKHCKITGHGECHWGMIHALLAGHGRKRCTRWRHQVENLTQAKRKWSWLPRSRTVTHCAMGNCGNISICRLKMVLNKFMKARSISTYQESDWDVMPAQNMLQPLCVYVQRDGTWAAFLRLCCYHPPSDPGHFVKRIFKNCYPAST